MSYRTRLSKPSGKTQACDIADPLGNVALAAVAGKHDRLHTLGGKRAEQLHQPLGAGVVDVGKAFVENERRLFLLIKQVEQSEPQGEIRRLARAPRHKVGTPRAARRHIGERKLAVHAEFAHTAAGHDVQQLSRVGRKAGRNPRAQSLRGVCNRANRKFGCVVLRLGGGVLFVECFKCGAKQRRLLNRGVQGGKRLFELAFLDFERFDGLFAEVAAAAVFGDVERFKYREVFHRRERFRHRRAVVCRRFVGQTLFLRLAALPLGAQLLRVADIVLRKRDGGSRVAPADFGEERGQRVLLLAQKFALVFK